MTREQVRKAIITSVLGYAIIIIVIFAISNSIKFITGYYPSLTYFTLSLLTLRLIEFNSVFLIAPILTAISVMIILLRISIDMRIASALGLSSYYIIVTLFFATIDAGDISYEAVSLWIFLTFSIGLLSAIVTGRFDK
ncbi:hypothetical protein [[Eubacterium] cellulosolvens]